MTKAEKEREESIKWHMSYCVHYNANPGTPILNQDKCAAGLCRKGRPCLKFDFWQKRVTQECEKCEYTPREEAERKVDETDAAIARMLIVQGDVSDFKKAHPNGGQGVIECRVCGKKMAISVSGYNRHARVTCETEGCISWIE